MHQTVIQAAASEQFLALKLCFIVKYTRFIYFAFILFHILLISCFLNEKKRIRGGQINTNNDSIDTSADIGISSILTW